MASKEEVIQQVTNGSYTKAEVRNLITQISTNIRTVTRVKKGDIFSFGSKPRPYLVLSKRKNDSVCVALSRTAEEISICKAETRWKEIDNSFITTNIIIVPNDIIINKTIGVYENNKHITVIKKLLKDKIKNSL